MVIRMTFFTGGMLIHLSLGNKKDIFNMRYEATFFHCGNKMENFHRRYEETFIIEVIRWTFSTGDMSRHLPLW